MKLDAFFRAFMPGGAQCLPSKGSVWYRDKALVTRRFRVHLPELNRLKQEVRDAHSALLSVWAPPAKGEEVGEVTVCVSTQEESEAAAQALAEVGSKWASASGGAGFQDDLHDAGRIADEARALRRLDTRFRELLEPLTLGDEDAEDLCRRGLHQQQIERACFKTWPGGQLCVPYMRSWSNGPEDSVVWNCRDPSLLIPARNAEGLITGLHVKPHRDTDGKYKWASVRKSFRSPDGGFPLFCCWYDWSPSETVALIEGGLKPCIFAHLAARVKVIGAAGGAFWQSPVELLHALARLQARKVVLFPDAGAALNYSVLLSYFRTFSLLLGWGVRVSIAWWGQLDKHEDLDADDLLADVARTDIGQMVMLSIPGFWDLVPRTVQAMALRGRHAAVFTAMV